MDFDNKPSNIEDLINLTHKEKENNNDLKYYNCLLNVVKKNNLYPLLNVKKFYNNENLLLLHNTYNRKSDDPLYNQCRSVILDFSFKTNNIVITYANSIPVRLNVKNLDKNIDMNENKLYEAFDGTMITVYYHKDKWHFGTSSCPDVNYSRFLNPNKTHGYLLNEVLETLFDSKNRENLTNNLDKNIAYEFLLLHNENKHIIDYKERFGENYKLLFHISSKNRETLENIDIETDKPLSTLGIKYIDSYKSLDEALVNIENNNYYGFIIKKNNNELYKISNDKIQFREETDPCNPNPWINILTVYMKNKKDYKVNDYLNYYNQNITLPLDNNGDTIDPTYLIHTVISTIKDILYGLYIYTTKYYPQHQRFKMDKDLDGCLSSVIQFHLAQLRREQITIYKKYIITSKNVFHYLCQHNTVKNIKILINVIINSTSEELQYKLSQKTLNCFILLNKLLSTKF